MFRRSVVIPIAVAGLMTAACATVPTGPSVMVLPGSAKTFEQFQADDGSCRQWALQQTGTSPNRAALGSTGTGAVVGTVLGAAAGAAIGAATGGAATGAAVGAGAGLLGGTVVGGGYAEAAGSSVQGRYDIAYMQCMYTKGNQIPVARGSQPYAASAARPAPAPPPDAIPAPPPGTPPPPPPGTR
jgi:Glycine-zipper domain